MPPSASFHLLTPLITMCNESIMFIRSHPNHPACNYRFLQPPSYPHYPQFHTLWEFSAHFRTPVLQYTTQLYSHSQSQPSMQITNIVHPPKTPTLWHTMQLPSSPDIPNPPAVPPSHRIRSSSMDMSDVFPPPHALSPPVHKDS